MSKINNGNTNSQNNNPQKTIAKPEEILQEARAKPESPSSDGEHKQPVELTAGQKENYKVLYYAGLLIAIVIILIFIDMHYQTILIQKKIPNDYCNSNVIECNELLSNLNSNSTERFINLFETSITKALLPIFTTILGYTIGIRKNS